MSRNIDVRKSVDPIFELIYNNFLCRTETGWRHKIMFLQAIDEGYWKLTVNDVFFGNHNESVHEDLLSEKKELKVHTNIQLKRENKRDYFPEFSFLDV